MVFSAVNFSIFLISSFEAGHVFLICSGMKEILEASTPGELRWGQSVMKKDKGLSLTVLPRAK